MSADPAERYDNKFVELNALEAALDADTDALRSILGHTTKTERRDLVKALNLLVDTMAQVPPEEL